MRLIVYFDGQPLARIRVSLSSLLDGHTVLKEGSVAPDDEQLHDYNYRFPLKAHS
jgi:hypothetical protein